jgi:hypothetical protein
MHPKGRVRDGKRPIRQGAEERTRAGEQQDHTWLNIYEADAAQYFVPCPHTIERSVQPRAMALHSSDATWQADFVCL